MKFQPIPIKRIISISILTLTALTLLTTSTNFQKQGPQQSEQLDSGQRYVNEIRHSLSGLAEYSRKIDNFKGYNVYVEQYNAKQYAYLKQKERNNTQYAGRATYNSHSSRSTNVQVLYADANMPLAEGSHYFYEGNCTRYVAANTTIPWSGNAGTWLEGAEEYGYEIKDVPEAGDIFVSDESAYGHTGIVKNVDFEKGTMTVEEMNYKGYGIVSQREIPLDSNRMKGFIDPDKKDNAELSSEEVSSEGIQVEQSDEVTDENATAGDTSDEVSSNEEPSADEQ